jgi:hypothetical protein
VICGGVAPKIRSVRDTFADPKTACLPRALADENQVPAKWQQSRHPAKSEHGLAIGDALSYRLLIAAEERDVRSDVSGVIGIYGLPLRCKRRIHFWTQDRTADNISGLSMRPPTRALMTFAGRSLISWSVSKPPFRLFLRRSDLLPSATTL